MNPEVKFIIGTVTQIFFLLFMIGSGIWVALDARRHGKPAKEYITWGVFSGWFIFLGLIVYLLWRKRFF